MPKVASKPKSSQKKIEQYAHTGAERPNNPPVGLVTPETDRDGGKKKYTYDPHLDPALQWAGKAERLSFEVPTVSLHVHERVDPKRIIEAVRKPHTNGQESLFEQNERPLREEIEFYKHRDGWSNRLIAGNSLLVMNSLLEKEGMAGKVQMVYFDPPYGITYGSNFQPFVNKRDVKDGKDEDLTAEPEMIKAFRDTWEMGIHSYLSDLRDRVLLAHSLLSETGSIFIQISDENVHHVREILDEVFGPKNFAGLIAFSKTTGFSGTSLSSIADYIVWYARNPKLVKYRQLFLTKEAGSEGASKYRPASTYGSIPKGQVEQSKLVTVDQLTSQGVTGESEAVFEFAGKKWNPPPGMHWKTTVQGLNKLAKAGRIVVEGNSIRYIRFFDDFPVFPISNIWNDIGGIQNRAEGKIYVVQTANLAIERCLLMTTDPGDLVLDITCGSGTTAFVAEDKGRRWITCDTSRVALTLAKQRMLVADFDFYQLAHPTEGVGSGFKYKTVPHVTLKSIANNEPATPETLYDQPLTDNSRSRITGPFTVEAVPAPMVRGMEDFEMDGQSASDASIARSGETLRQSEWREELLSTGVRGKGGAKIEFTRIEPMLALKDIQAEGETKDGKKVYIVFGPEFAPLEQRQVERAWQEAKPYKPDMLLFCAFQFDDEAAKDIDEMKPELSGMQMLKVQMNADLLTDDLLKKRRSNESFWLIGQPDIGWTEDKDGMITVEIRGWDYYNPKTGNVESGKKTEVAMWLLDTDYDERSLFPTQVFLPMAGDKEGWSKLAKNLRAEIDEEKIEAYRGTVSLPFEKPKSGRFAVKIIDDRGIESLRVVKL